MDLLVSFISGLLFSTGLIISGMTNPNKVIGFLDIFGEWDYSLALVMLGAIGTNITLYPFVLKKKPLYSLKHYLPINKTIDRKLIIGATLFGIGWGLVGICPGPSIVNLGLLNLNSLIFVIAMILGMFIHKKGHQ